MSRFEDIQNRIAEVDRLHDCMTDFIFELEKESILVEK